MYLVFIYPNLVATMRERGVGCKELADILDIGYYSAYRRLRGFVGWKLGEIVCLCKYFGIPDAEWLFTRSDTIAQKC